MGFSAPPPPYKQYVIYRGRGALNPNLIYRWRGALNPILIYRGATQAASQQIVDEIAASLFLFHVLR